MHLFYVGTNLVDAFAIGYPTEPDNFYIAGETLFNAPLISCRILGPSGEFLFGLEKNKLTPDSPSRYRQLAFRTQPGWCIKDDTDKDVLAIETVEGEEAKETVRSLDQSFPEDDLSAHSVMEQLARDADKVTRIYGEFFDKQGRLAARGDEAGLSLNCPAQFG